MTAESHQVFAPSLPRPCRPVNWSNPGLIMWQTRNVVISSADAPPPDCDACLESQEAGCPASLQAKSGKLLDALRLTRGCLPLSFGLRAFLLPSPSRPDYVDPHAPFFKAVFHPLQRKRIIMLNSSNGGHHAARAQQDERVFMVGSSIVLFPFSKETIRLET